MAPAQPGDPQESPRPQPIGNMPMIFLFTTCTLCVLFILWRRADALRRVVGHQLKTISRPEGRIRLSVDDGPPAREFLGDDDSDDEHEPLPPPDAPLRPLYINTGEDLRRLREVDRIDDEIKIAYARQLEDCNPSISRNMVLIQ
ncbi:hypothetical protein H0H92_010300 [Tricholoma furcatifolium]|nr:hypothetical protein H0H92_010300 [Tricholoma furcatifolium]